MLVLLLTGTYLLSSPGSTGGRLVLAAVAASVDVVLLAGPLQQALVWGVAGAAVAAQAPEAAALRLVWWLLASTARGALMGLLCMGCIVGRQAAQQQLEASRLKAAPNRSSTAIALRLWLATRELANLGESVLALVGGKAGAAVDACTRRDGWRKKTTAAHFGAYCGGGSSGAPVTAAEAGNSPVNGPAAGHAAAFAAAMQFAAGGRDGGDGGDGGGGGGGVDRDGDEYLPALHAGEGVKEEDLLGL